MPSLPKRYFSVVHGNLAQGKPLKPYDGLVDWMVVRTQVSVVCRFMAFGGNYE